MQISERDWLLVGRYELRISKLRHHVHFTPPFKAKIKLIGWVSGFGSLLNLVVRHVIQKYTSGQSYKASMIVNLHPRAVKRQFCIQDCNVVTNIRRNINLFTVGLATDCTLKMKKLWGAQWICLRLSSCRPGFESQKSPSMLLSLIVKFVLDSSCIKSKNKQKRGWIWSIKSY